MRATFRNKGGNYPWTLSDVKRLDKTYSNGQVYVKALKQINLSFAQGEFCADHRVRPDRVKSTLLHVLGGPGIPHRGDGALQGVRDLFAYNDNQLSILRRRRFGFVFQAYNLVQELTAQENILLPVVLDKKKPDETAY